VREYSERAREAIVRARLLSVRGMAFADARRCPA